jgi:hypothetical protein
MDLALWTFLYVALTAFIGWIIFGDGIDRIGGTVGIVFLGADPGWSEEGIKLFVGAVWLAATGWFFYGLTSPSARFGHWF